jgi:hypothetical protein
MLDSFFLRHRLQTGSGAHPISYPIGTGDKAAGSEADYSTPSSAEVKNTWSHTSNSKYFFMLWCLIKKWTRLRGVVLN